MTKQCLLQSDRISNFAAEPSKFTQVADGFDLVTTRLHSGISILQIIIDAFFMVVRN